MKTKQLILCATLAAALVAPAFGQQVDDAAVVVSVMGKDFTAGQIARLRAGLPTQYKTNTQHMNNRTFLETFGYLQALATLAEEDRILEREPYKSQFEFNRLNFLAQTYLSQINSTLEISNDDKQAYYEEHKDEYSQVRVSMIALEYTPVPELAEKAGKTVISERDAWEEAENLLIELRQGADFAELAKEHSDDSATAAKGGDLGIIEPAAAGVSEQLKAVIFKLAEGQVSPSVKEGGRYYLFKVTARTPRAYNEVAGDVLRGLQGQKLKEKLDEIRGHVRIDDANEAYLQAKPQ